MKDSLQRGREAYERQAWAEAYAALAEADHSTRLDAEDLDRLATAAALIGLDEASAAARTRAFQRFLDGGDSRRAAGSALWRLLSISDQKHRQAEVGGWLARAERLLAGDAGDSAERGFLLCLGGHRKAGEGDMAGARAAFTEALGIGEELPGEDEAAFHSVGGFVMDRLNRVPSAGDSFECQGWRFEVLDMDQRRVDKVLATQVKAP